MEIDEVRGQLYYFSDGNKFFRVRLSDLAILANYQLTRDGTFAGVYHPHMYLDDNGHLYLAWTTIYLDFEIDGHPPYWSIHFMQSLDGGVTWRKPNGRRLATPIIADHTGPTHEITGAGEWHVNTWLSTFIVKGDKAHFIYYADSPVNKEHYVRYDLATGRIDRNIIPFEGDGASIANLDGFYSTGRSIKEIFCISKSNSNNIDSRLAVLKSEDNGLTWRNHALGPLALTYAVGGSPQVTNDGYIIGSYTDITDPGKYVVKFFKIASLAEPSRKDIMPIAGAPNLIRSERDSAGRAKSYERDRR
jgi:hypothetical protein